MIVGIDESFEPLHAFRYLDKEARALSETNRSHYKEFSKTIGFFAQQRPKHTMFIEARYSRLLSVKDVEFVSDAEFWSFGPQMNGTQLTFDDLPSEVNVQVLSPERLYEVADKELLQILGEDIRLERKRASIGRRELGEYFSMWANTPGGGLIVLGQDDKGTFLGLSTLPQQTLNDYEVTGYDFCPDAIYECKRIPFDKTDGGKDFVLLFYVNYHQSKAVCTTDGRYFVRIGSRKRQLKGEEIRQIRLDKGEVSVEQEPVELKYPQDFDMQSIRTFVETVRKQNGLDVQHDTEDILELRHLGVRRPDAFVPNLACALLFAKDVLKVVPGCRIRFLRFEGEEEGAGDKWNAVKDQYIDGTLPEQIRKCEEVMHSQLRTFSRLGSGGKFLTVPEYPDSAWYEAIVNACVHRTYSNGLRNANIFVKMFDDRLEVESPGPFPPFVTPENIYEVHSPRNPFLMNALWFMDFVKCAHEGTRRMRQSMKEMELPNPEFRQQEVGRALVKVTLRNSVKHRKVWIDSDVIDLVGRTIALELTESQKRCINFVAEHGAISVSDAQRLTGKSWQAARKLLGDLVDRRILAHKHKSGKERDSTARFTLPASPSRGSDE